MKLLVLFLLYIPRIEKQVVKPQTTRNECVHRLRHSSLLFLLIASIVYVVQGASKENDGFAAVYTSPGFLHDSDISYVFERTNMRPVA